MTTSSIAARLWGNARIYATDSSSKMDSEKHVRRLEQEIDAAVKAKATEMVSSFMLKELKEATERLGAKKDEIKSLKKRMASDAKAATEALERAKAAKKGATKPPLSAMAKAAKPKRSNVAGYAKVPKQPPVVEQKVPDPQPVSPPAHPDAL